MCPIALELQAAWRKGSGQGVGLPASGTSQGTQEAVWNPGQPQKVSSGWKGAGKGFFDVTEPLHPCSLQVGLQALNNSNNEDGKEAGTRPVPGPQELRIPLQTHCPPLSHVCGPDIYGRLHPCSHTLSLASESLGRHQKKIEGQKE